MKVNKSRPIILFETLKGIVTRSRPSVGEIQEVTGAELMD
jgi:hypothetical protein